MSSASKARTSETEARTDRERLRGQGLRPIRLWVPDTRSAAFRAEAHRQSKRVAAGEHAGDDQAFVEAASVDWDEE